MAAVVRCQAALGSKNAGGLAARWVAACRRAAPLPAVVAEQAALQGAPPPTVSRQAVSEQAVT
jgi:hypothetical protein